MLMPTPPQVQLMLPFPKESVGYTTLIGVRPTESLGYTKLLGLQH